MQVGIDTVEIKRIESLVQNKERFLERVFSEKEQEEFIDKFFNEKSEEEQMAVLMKALDNLQFSGSVNMQDIISDLVKCFKTVLKNFQKSC